MTTKTEETLHDQVKEIQRKYKDQVSPLRDELAGIHPFFNGFPENATEEEITAICARVAFLEVEIERLIMVRIERIRTLYIRNNALAKTLIVLSRLRNQSLTEVKTGYHRCDGWAREEDGSYGAYFCKNCGWVADIPTLVSLGFDHLNSCRICGSFV